MRVTVLRGLFRTVVVALSILAAQIIVRANTVGFWAMVSLGIGSAVAGVLVTRYVAHARTRRQEALWQFVVTTLLLEGYYLVLPKLSVWAIPDAILAGAVGVVSGLSEWVVPDVAAVTTRRT
jgi:hypothetical protein